MGHSKIDSNLYHQELTKIPKKSRLKRNKKIIIIIKKTNFFEFVVVDEGVVPTQRFQEFVKPRSSLSYFHQKEYNVVVVVGFGVGVATTYRRPRWRRGCCRRQERVQKERRQTWLKLQKVWRFIGLASASMGMICFALSSSFNSLFGEWNFLKTFLYIIFSFIICFAVLFANAWPQQHSSSLRLEAHMAFLVLTITAFYSFFFDKAVKGKPNVYSLVSCASFAVMSLSLSMQIHCGFEVDLLYFFLGALIIQLMKIRWLLGIAGAGFSYFLIILRSSCIDLSPEENRYTELQDQSHMVIEVNSLQLQSDASNGSALIKPKLLASLEALKKHNGKLVSILYGRTIVERSQSNIDHNLFIDGLPSEIINDLNEAIKLAVAAGFENDCCNLYSLCRREFLRQCLPTLELDELGKEYEETALTPHRVWRWIKAFEFALTMLFPREHRLCDLVFHGFSSIGDLSFVLVCNEVTFHLLKFAETFAVEICSPRVFIDVNRVFMKLTDIIPKLESLFPDQFGLPLRNEAIRVRKRLGEAIRGTFMNLGNQICSDDTTVIVPGGIYSSIRDMMECLRIAMSYRISIEQIFKEYPIIVNREETSSSLFAEMGQVMELLVSNLEAKSRNYTEPGLDYVSMMNNIMFIKQQMEILSPGYGKEKLSGLDHIFSTDQIQKHTAKVRQCLEDYIRSSWNEVLGCLKLDSNDVSVAPDVAAELMKEKLELFNIKFDEICRIQSRWFASDDVRKEIMMSIEKVLLPWKVPRCSW